MWTNKAPTGRRVASLCHTSHFVWYFRTIACHLEETPVRLRVCLTGPTAWRWPALSTCLCSTVTIYGAGRLSSAKRYRSSAGDTERSRKFAAELVALNPDLIVASGVVTVAPLLQITRTVPIVFVNVGDPVGAGLVDSLARPGGNATGFALFEYSLSAKWLELLKQIAPSVTRAAVLRDPAVTSGIGQFAVIQSVAPSVGIEASRPAGTDADQVRAGDQSQDR